MDRKESNAIHFKVVVLGDWGVGKSCLALSFVNRTFSVLQAPTLGIAFMTQSVCLNGVLVKYQIWDTAGQEQYKSLAKLYYRGAHAAIVVYDITKRDKYIKAKEWLNILDRDVGPNIVVALAGSKADLWVDRQVEAVEAQAYADQRNLIFMETSAKSLLNVNELFLELTRRLLSKESTNGKEGSPDSSKIHLNIEERNSRCYYC